MSAKDYLLYPLGGVLVGAGLSMAVTGASVPLPASSTSSSVLALGAVGLGTVLILRTLRRERPAAHAEEEQAARRAPEATPTPVRSPVTPPRLAIALPDILDHHPDAWGVGEPLTIHVEGPDDASVSLLAGERRLGTATVREGTAAFRVKWERPGSVTIVARTEVDGRAATATRDVDVVRYDEEVERLYAAFQEWARETYPETGDALTARELVERLKRVLGTGVEAPLVEATRVYELVNYGEREADRALYLRLVDALADLADHADSGAGEMTPRA